MYLFSDTCITTVAVIIRKTKPQGELLYAKNNDSHVLNQNTDTHIGFKKQTTNKQTNKQTNNKQTNKSTCNLIFILKQLCIKMIFTYVKVQHVNQNYLNLLRFYLEKIVA